MQINTNTDAQTFVSNSGIAEWEWGGNASSEGFAEWLYQNKSEINESSYDEELRDYLTSVGEDPKDYDV